MKSLSRASAAIARKAEYLRDGVPLPLSIWNNTLQIAEELGVAPPDLAAS